MEQPTPEFPIRRCFDEFVNNPQLRPLHVARAITALSSALMELASLDKPSHRRNVNGADLAALFVNQDPALLADIERRQVTLASMFFTFVKMTEENFYSLDIGVHLAVAEALVRYEAALVATRQNRAFGYASTVDAEAINAALGTVLATLAMAYHIDDDNVALPPSTSALHVILETARRDLVPSKKVVNFARCIRIIILQRFQLSLSDAAFMVRLVSSSRRQQLAAAAGESALTLITLLVEGRPRIETSLSRVASQALERLAIDDRVPESTIGALAAPLWFLLVVISASRILDVVRQVSEVDESVRKRFSHITQTLFGPKTDFAQQLAGAVH